MKFVYRSPLEEREARNHNKPVDPCGERHGIAEVQNRCGVDKDEVSALGKLCKESCERLRASELGRIRRKWTDGNTWSIPRDEPSPLAW